MTILYVLAVLSILMGIGSLIQALKAARHMKSWRPRGTAAVESLSDRDSVIVFCPCRGIDHEFEKNVQSILDQDYPQFQVQFIVDSGQDEAYAALRRFGISNILIAGPAADRGQKVHNLGYAVERAGGGADIYVFCDSDARFPNNWLSNLVAPLTGSAGVTTGYRWYAAKRFHLPTLLRSAWNGVALSALGDHSHNFAWGGSLAIRRKTFEQIGVLGAWRGSLSDDYAITRAAKAAGLKIVFVPPCVIPAYGTCGWAELLEFTTRQMIITRVYYPGLWRLAMVTYPLFNLTFAGLAIAAPGNAVAAALWAAIYALAACKAWIRMHALKTVLPPAVLSRGAWFYILCAPLVSLLYLYNMIHSALSRTIVWRNIRYELISPHETRVTKPAASPGES